LVALDSDQADPAAISRLMMETRTTIPWAIHQPIAMKAFLVQSRGISAAEHVVL